MLTATAAGPRKRPSLALAAAATSVLSVAALLLAAGSVTASAANLEGSGTSAPALRPAATSTPTVAWMSPVGRFVTPELLGMHGMGPDDPSQGAVAGSFRLPQAEWQRVERKPGIFTWDDLDAAIAASRQRGAQDVLLMIGLTPGWAASDGPPGAAAMTRPPMSIQMWERWVDAVSHRYRGEGYAYQVWNEANLSTFWTGTPEEMADLTHRAFRIIHNNDPTATVVAASTTLRLPYSFSQFYPRYLSALRADGWPVDAFSAHTYPVSTGSPKTRQALISDYLTALRKAGAPRLPVWDTEVNYGLAGPGPAYPEKDINGDTAARWVALTYIDTIRLGLSRSYWYQQQPVDDFLGVQMWSDTPGLAAERWIHNFVVTRRWRGCSTDKLVVRCRLTAAEGTSWLVWTRPGRASAAVRVPAGATSACDARGRCVSVTPRQQLRISGVPVRLGPGQG